MSVFQFKQFSIKQEKSAMKVGTDSVLLGAWTPCQNTQTILDIGAGTGLLSLMMAQRSKAKIDAVEVDTDAFEECIFNTQQSKWAERISCYNIDFKEFAKNQTQKYDLIISNPPFFTETIFSSERKRNLARFTQGLSFEDLLFWGSNLLNSNGLFSVIIPFQNESNFIKIASENQLFPKNITRIRGNHHSPLKRSLLLFSKEKNNITENELIIEISRNNYTSDYQNLTKDFYLHF